MPELPEVETVRRSLLPHVSRRRLLEVRVRDARLRTPVDVPALRALLPGRRVLGLRRRAKYLLFDLEGGTVLLVHLGMTGVLNIAPPQRPLRKHDHVVIDLEGGRQIRFHDPRRFGLVEALPAGAESNHPRLRHLGVEPLGPAFEPRALAAAAAGRRQPIKSFLMDGRRIVGVGNIYACEALFLARIHPRRAAGRLAPARWQRLARAVRHVLNDALTKGGTTLRDFADADGEAGYFGLRLRVYDREGLACRRCGRAVRRTVQSGRGTFYCPGCQRSRAGVTPRRPAAGARRRRGSPRPRAGSRR